MTSATRGDNVLFYLLLFGGVAVILASFSLVIWGTVDQVQVGGDVLKCLVPAIGAYWLGTQKKS